jgi:GT2 family glycosyltransferase
MVQLTNFNMPNPRVGIIILNWNNAPDTLACLASVGELDYPNFQIIVVDNGSSDDSTGMIASQYPAVDLIRNAGNLGYAEGNNIGIRQALAGGADYVLLLNNDTLVEPGLVSTLIAVAESDERIGIVAPKVYYAADRERIWSAGGRIDWRTGQTWRLRAEEVEQAPDSAQPSDVDFGSGCALCIKRQVIERVGLMDARFFIYYEETDWCVRAQRADFRIVYVPAARIWHKVSATMKTDSPSTAYYMSRNVFLFLRKSLPALPATRAVAWQLLSQARTIAALSLKSKYRSRRPERNARLAAMRDSLSGRHGMWTE